MVASATILPQEGPSFLEATESAEGPTLAEILSAHTAQEEESPDSDKSPVFASHKGTYSSMAEVLKRMHQLMDLMSRRRYTLTLRSPAIDSTGNPCGEYIEILERKSDGTWEFARIIWERG